LASENYSTTTWDIVWRCLRDPTFSRFSRTPTCDRQTDRQTATHRVKHSQNIEYLHTSNNFSEF